MSNITFTPDRRAALEEWLDSCPRELANLVFVSIAQMKDNDGNCSHLGMSSIVATKRSDALAIISETIETLAEWHNKLATREI